MTVIFNRSNINNACEPVVYTPETAVLLNHIMKSINNQTIKVCLSLEGHWARGSVSHRADI